MAKNLNVKKNKKSYDSKIITWISAGLAAFVAIVIAIVVIITYTKSYVAKVDGLKIYDHEYTYFLQSALYKEQQDNFEEPEGYDDMTEAEKYEVFTKFWTEERKAKCVDDAIEEARQFKAQYRLAIDKGYKLSSDREKEIKESIDSTYELYIQYGLTKEYIEQAVFAGMSRSDYKDFVLMMTTIENYKDAIKADMNPPDDVLRGIYDENPDDYRKIGVRSFKINIGAKKPTDEKADGYQTELDKYNEAREEAIKYAEEIRDTYNSGKFMSTYKKNPKGDYVLDENGDKIVDRKNLTFEDYVKTESDDSNSSKTGGLEEINNNNKSTVDEITEYALSMVWNADRSKIVKSDAEASEASAQSADEGSSDEAADTNDDAESADDEDKDKEDEDKKDENTVRSDYEIIETDTAIYVVCAESITDYENSEESKEGAADSIKDVIKAEYLEDKAVEALKKEVNDLGSKYSVGSRKNDLIDELSQEVFKASGI